MNITDHAVFRFRQRFSNRNIAFASEEKVRAYLCCILKKAHEIVPKEPSDAVHKISHRIVFVCKNQKVITVFRFEADKYKPKVDKFRYLNNSSRKRRELRGY